MPAGRPWKYSPKLAAKICELIADGKRMKDIEQMPGMPSRRSITNWLGQFPEFDVMYTRAREELALSMADEILEIADDGSNDWMEGRFGDQIPDREVVLRSRLRVDTRKWLMSKILPKKFGDRIEVEHDVSDSFADRLIKARERALTAPVIEHEAAE